jgi:hypothetical protein
LSPILFLFFINDIIDEFEFSDDDGIDKLHLLALLFADDTALFAKSPGELQSLLDQLHSFCSKSGIAVNTGKQRLLYLRRGSQSTSAHGRIME